MTADNAGKAAAQGIWATLRMLKEQWVVIVFVTGALFWARDTWEELSKLPATVAAQVAETADLLRRVERVEARLGDGTVPARAGLTFPGDAHGASDARPGGWSDIRLDPVVSDRGCVALAIDPHVVDAGGRWFGAEATISTLPVLEPTDDLAFAVRVPAEVPPGRAAIALRFVLDCGGGRVAVAAPRLPFRVLDD